MPKREIFTKQDLEDWGDPRAWDKHGTPSFRSDPTQGGRNALSDYRLWKTIDQELARQKRLKNKNQ